MSYVACPLCHALANVLPPHGDGPCPLAAAEHEARLAVLKAQRRYWLDLAAAADRAASSEALTAVEWPQRQGPET